MKFLGPFLSHSLEIELFLADAIGSGGVQLFVDAGRPIDETLVKALVKEVLMEKIAAMLSDGGSIERIPGPTAPIVRQQSPTLDMVVDMVRIVS